MTDGTKQWLPISDYKAEMGRVVVWLRWHAFSKTVGRPEAEGTWYAAYLLALNDGAVWVQEKDCIPIETTGRRVTHFLSPWIMEGPK